MWNLKQDECGTSLQVVVVHYGYLIVLVQASHLHPCSLKPKKDYNATI